MAAPGKYSAGTIFLQVVPVFRDTMKQIRDETKKLSDGIGDDLEAAGRKGGQRAGKAMGEEMEKAAEDSGDKAGKKYLGSFETGIKNSIKSAQKELNSLSFKDSEVALTEEFARIKRKLDKLAKVNLEVDFDEKELLADIAVIQGAVESLSKKDHDLRFDVNMAELSKALATVEKRAQAVADKKREIEFTADLDVVKVNRKVGTFEKNFRTAMKRAADSLGDNLSQEISVARAKLEALGDADLSLDFNSGEAMAELERIKFMLTQVSAQDLDIDADVDVAAALAHIKALDIARERVDGKDININADVNTGTAIAKIGILSGLLAAFRPRANGVASASDNAANSFRSFNFMILGAVVLLPALVPMVAALGGGLMALIPILGALGAGLGVAILGFSGIGDAVSELGKVADEQKIAAGTAEKGARSVAAATHAVADAERALADARRNAARANADAARAVADARRNAARSIEDAYERQKEAAEEYRDAQESVKEAEQDLREAREQAAADAADIATRQRAAAADERQRLLDLFTAQTEYNAIMADGASTAFDKEQASVNLEQAQIALNDIRAEQTSLAEEKADYDKNGVDGTDEVKDAQDRLLEAIEAQKEAQEGVKEAAKDTKRVQLEAARDVADALRNQARTAADGARAVADAQRNLQRAHESQAQAVTDAAVESTAAMDRLTLAMDKLSPAGRKFARFLHGLRGGFRELRDGVQEAMLPGVQKGLQYIIDTYGPQFKAFTVEMGDAVGDIFADTGKGLGGPAWQSFFETYAPLLPKLTRQFAKTTGNWMTAYAAIFEVVAPYAERLSEALLDMSKRAEKFFTSAKGKNEVREFMEYAFEVGPKVVGFIGDLAQFFVDIGQALAPIGEAVLDALSGVFEWLSNLNPKDVQFFVTALIGLVVAFQLAVGMVALIAAGGAVFASTAGAFIFIFVAIAVAAIAAYKRFKGFRDVVDEVISYLKVELPKLGAKFMELWEEYIKPAINDYIIPAVQAFGEWVIWLWKNVIWPYLGYVVKFWVATWKTVFWVIDKIVIPVVNALIDIVKFLWKWVIKPILTWILDGWRFLARNFKRVWDNILWPVIDLFIHAIQKLWRDYIKPRLADIKADWADLAGKFQKVWREYIKPLLEAFGDFIEKHVEPKFAAGIKLITDLWDGLKNKLAEPVKFFIEKIINEGIIDGFNWIARKVGSTEIDHMDLPAWVSAGTENSHAQGTAQVLPGYTPGRDVHSFYSPTAGRLNLSGGEAIMRPEFTAAVGKSGIDYLNNIAKRGPGAVRSAMGFASGGVYWPVPGRDVGTYAGHDGVDINRGAGDDDLGDLIRAVHDGVVAYVGTGKGYGNSIWINGTDGYTSLYGHTSAAYVNIGQRVIGGQPIGAVGNTGNSSAPHLHFGIYPGGTYESAMAYLSGAAPWIGDKKSEYGGASFPDWAKDILGAPVNWAKDLIAKPIQNMREKFGDNAYVNLLADVPTSLVKAIAHKAEDMIPSKSSFNPLGGVIGMAGGLVNAAEEAFKNGGVVPYNGAMMYDSGGYLPPGLTTVLNMTGKPEPVFTSGQFDSMGRGGDGEGFTYAPTFNGSDLTAADVVDDLDFTRRKIKREGRYGRNKTS